MNRKIDWESGVFDEIELVYEKAESDPSIGAQLEQLEQKALDEAKENCFLVGMPSGTGVTPEMFEAMPAAGREKIIRILGRAGLSSISQKAETALIVIRLSPVIQSVLACTVFDILNRFEKLDGAITLLKPKWTLELQVPLGGKKSLMQWELLIMQLYPWVSVRETSTNEIASAPARPAAPAPSPAAAPGAPTGGAAKDGAPAVEPKEEKKSFFKKLFGK